MSTDYIPSRRSDTRAASSSSIRQPLYVQVAHAIADRISSGTYPVGSLLPTEEKLCQVFRVSRHTVRQAYQHLRNQGLISARKGVGTRVEAKAPNVGYSHSTQSISDLLHYAQGAPLKVRKVEEARVDTRIAERIGCRSGRTWLRVSGVREIPGANEPHCLTEIYIDPAYGELVRDLGAVEDALWMRIEQQFGEVIVEVAQEEVSAPADVVKRIDELKKQSRKSVLLLLANPQGELRFVALRIEGD